MSRLRQTPPKVEDVKDALKDLVRVKKGDVVDIASYAPVTESARVRNAGVEITDIEALRRVLKDLLGDLHKEETAARRSQKEEEEEKRSKQTVDEPTGKPAMILFGLVPGTEKQGVGARQERAALARAGVVGSMRKEAEKIIREVAVYLTSTPLTVDKDDTDTKSGSPWLKIEALRAKRHAIREGLDVAPDELADVIFALAESYDAFANELRLLVCTTAQCWDLSDCSPEEDTIGLAEQIYVDNFDEARPLRALVPCLDGDIPLAETLCRMIMEVEGPPFDGLGCLFGRLLTVVDGYLFRPGGRETELLKYIAAKDDNNLHRFLSLLEADESGSNVLRQWNWWLRGTPKYDSLPDKIKDLAPAAEYVLSKNVIELDYVLSWLKAFLASRDAPDLKNDMTRVLNSVERSDAPCALGA